MPRVSHYDAPPELASALESIVRLIVDPRCRKSPLMAAAVVFILGGCHRAPSESTPTPPPFAEWDAYSPKIAPASKDAEHLSSGVRLPEGFEITLFAAEPLLANPVAFAPDGLGRFLVCETFRQEDFGVPDNRSFPEWVDDDLAATTVDDRHTYYLKHHPEVVETWTKEEDRLRLVWDSTGNGRADRSRVFAGGFKGLLDGTGAGVARIGHDVFYTCIPHLWRLRDEDGDGRAEVRESLAYGFGVRTALRGHDLHGLIQGPDGRVYFSVGDRGYSVQVAGGAKLVDPGRGAVFRCEPDGSGLEVFATGLRNPQELAFDDFGNLITGDNNSDGDDQARIVYVVEGAEIGWRMNYQTLSSRGPWVEEGWWKPWHEGQASFLIPPIANLGNGPSGITAAPGTGLPAAYAGAFFLCDFVGTRAASTGGVWAFWLEPDGAGLRLDRSEKFLRGLLPTDVDFAPDGGLYVSDFGHGWVGEGKGRLYRITHREARNDPALREVALWSQLDVSQVSSATLRDLVAHPDRRLRMRAQFELANRPEGRRILLSLAQGSSTLLARLHGIWGLGQLGRRQPGILQSVLPLLQDSATEVRAQAASVLADVALPSAREALERALVDSSLRVRRFAVMALGRIAAPSSAAALIDVARGNADRDIYLRHAVVVALQRIAVHSPDVVLGAASDPSVAVRRVVLLALRRGANPAVARFLDDADSSLRTEAARAIYDVPIEAAWPALATRIPRHPRDDLPFLRRAAAANDLFSDEASAARLAAIVGDGELPEEVRGLALRALSRWPDPPLRDLVLNEHRPRAARRTGDAAAPAATVLEPLLRTPGSLRALAARAAGHLQVASLDGALASLLENAEATVAERIAALDALAERRVERLDRFAAVALRSAAPRLRGRGCEVLGQVDPERAVEVAKTILIDGEIAERQMVLAFLGRVGSQSAHRLLSDWMRRILANEVPTSLRLDVVDAVRARVAAGASEFESDLANFDASRAAQSPVDRWSDCLEGGDADRGRGVFSSDTVNCRRCHALEAKGPLLAGPPLARVGLDRDRRHLLESIVAPNAVVLAGYENERIELASGRTYDGRVLEERDGTLLIEFDETGVPEREHIPLAQITSRTKGRSGMPEDVIEKISAKDLRDLVEFLSRQRLETATPTPR